MGSDASTAYDILSIPSTFKVHRAMCTELIRLVNRASILLPKIEDARPRCSSGIQALCSLHRAIEKAKIFLQHCSEDSQLYLVYTAEIILSRCERSRQRLEQSFLQIQNNVPVLLAIEISRLVDDLRSATFTLDPYEEEAGKVIRQLILRGAPDSGSVENFELIAFKSATSKLHITSQAAILIERRSIRKLLTNVGGNDPNKKKILTYFFYLFKQYGNQIVAERSETIKVESDNPVLDNDVRCHPEPRLSGRVEDQTSLQDALSDEMLLEEFKCPLSSRLMYDPVVIASGQTYERMWIQKWFDEGNDTCPKTKQKLDNLLLTPNAKMKDLISKWCTKKGVVVSDPSMDLNTEAMPSLDYSATSIASIGNSMNDFHHLHVDLSNVSLGSLDTSFSSESSLAKIRGMEDDKKKSLESIRTLSENSWSSQCELVEDFRHKVDYNGQVLFTASSEDFLHPVLRFGEEAIHHGDIKAQTNAAQLLLTYFKTSRHGSKKLIDESLSLVTSLLGSAVEVKEKAFAILEMLSSQPHCRREIAASGALALVSNALCSRSWDHRGYALRILHNLSLENDLRLLIFSLDSIVPNLVPCLKDNELSSHALTIMQNLCDIEAARIAITETSDCIASMAELLDIGNNEEKEIVLSIFLMLCSQKLEYCQLVLDDGFAVFPALMSIYTNGSEKLKVSAMELFRLLKDVSESYEPHPNENPSRTDPGPSQPSDEGDHHKEKKKKSSSRSSGLFSFFSKSKR